MPARYLSERRPGCRQPHLHVPRDIAFSRKRCAGSKLTNHPIFELIMRLIVKLIAKLPIKLSNYHIHNVFINDPNCASREVTYHRRRTAPASDQICQQIDE